jgi:hypothetical protein
MRLIALALAASLATLTSAKPVDAGNKSVSLGEVAVLPHAALGMTSALKTALESELHDLDLRATRKDAILSASLVKLDAERGPGIVSSATCVISITLRSRNDGVLFAVLEGRARAQGSSDHVPESAIRGAVHGALVRVPEALR